MPRQAPSNGKKLSSNKGWWLVASRKKLLLLVVCIVFPVLATTCDRVGAPDQPPPPSAPTPTAAAPNGSERSVAAEQSAVPRPSAVPPAAPSNFPAVVGEFIKLNTLQQKEFTKTFKGIALNGTGNVFEVDACDLLDDSADRGSTCVKLVLDSGASRVVLYFDEQYKAMLAKFRKDQRVAFEGCRADSVRNWGFGPLVTCDMR
jgi:hypothetical protein